MIVFLPQNSDDLFSVEPLAPPTSRQSDARNTVAPPSTEDNSNLINRISYSLLQMENEVDGEWLYNCLVFGRTVFG